MAVGYEDFKNAFKQRIPNKTSISSVMKYHQVKNSDYYENIVFVEGSSDKRFYIKTRINELSHKAYYIYSSQMDEYRGKESVIKAFNLINNDQRIKDGLTKCIFIIDQDWSDIPDGVYATAGHSMESFFLEENNIKKLFSVINDKEDVECFEKIYKRFWYESADFWALKATMVYATDNGIHINYKKRNSFETIFDYAFENNEIKYNKQLMDAEINSMRQSVLNNKLLIKYYNKTFKKIKDNRNFVRGHEAFRLLQCFLENKYGLKLDLYSDEEENLLKKCIKDFIIGLIPGNNVAKKIKLV